MPLETTRNFDVPTGISTNFAMIPVGTSLFAIVDPDDEIWLRKLKWEPRYFNHNTYAIAWILVKGKKVRLNMHRMIAHTAKTMVCHHVNGRTLDNRKQNLQNLIKRIHNDMHRNHTLKVKYTPFPPGR